MTDLLAIGTRKGLWLARSDDDRRSWDLQRSRRDNQIFMIVRCGYFSASTASTTAST